MYLTLLTLLENRENSLKSAKKIRRKTEERFPIFFRRKPEVGSQNSVGKSKNLKEVLPRLS